MAHGTTNVDGHGFIARDVPTYLDEACKSAPHLVCKGRRAAEKKADREAQWADKVGLGWEYTNQVEGVVAAQIEGFPGLWFVVWIYTDEQAAESLAKTPAAVRAEAIRRDAVRA